MGTCTSGGGATLDQKRWMLFVDGENFTLRAQALASDSKIVLPEGERYCRDVFVWFPTFQYTSSALFPNSRHQLQWTPIRAYYYTSLIGDGLKMEEVRTRLWKLGFQPQVFFKSKDRKAKSVDIALTKDMLTHAFFDHYDVAILMSGDGDYVPLVNEVKRMGKVVCVGAFAVTGLSTELKLSSDELFDVGPKFRADWTDFLERAR